MKSKKNESGHFDVLVLHAALDSERRARHLAWKDVAMESGISASTLTRLSQGRQPDVNSLAALTSWLGMSADHFMGNRATDEFGSASPLAQISTIIHQDPNLNADAATALEELVKATYARLRTDKRK